MEKHRIGPINALQKSLAENKIDEGICEKVLEGAWGIKPGCKPEKLAGWLFDSMARMDELLDDDAKRKVREDCACCLGGRQKKLCTETNKNRAAYEERIAALNSGGLFGKGERIKIVGPGKYEAIFQEDSQPEKRCVCSNFRLNGLGKAWSKTYCLCCAGHVRRHMETALGKKLRVECVSSALASMGKDNCRFRLSEV